MLLKQKNFHPLDSRIEFDEKNHVYYIDNVPYDISVTGFVKSFFEEFDTDDVIKKIMINGKLINIQNTMVYLLMKLKINGKIILKMHL